MEGPGASGLGLGSALWPGESCTSGRDRSTSALQRQMCVSIQTYVAKEQGAHKEGLMKRHTDRLHSTVLRNSIKALVGINIIYSTLKALQI